MRKIDENEKKYISVYMHPDSAKQDLTYFKNHYQFKANVSYLSAIMIGVAIALIVFGASIAYSILALGLSCLGLGLVLVVVSMLFLRKVEIKKRLKFLDSYEKAIVNNCTIKYPNYYALSALYPLYLFFDNETKVIKLVYQDKEYIYCEYDDILNYKILEDNVVLENRTRLPENINKKTSSYIIEITFNNKKRAQIGFNNTFNKFILAGKYDFQQFANTNSINNIARMLDCIILKNEIDPNRLKND